MLDSIPEQKCQFVHLSSFLFTGKTCTCYQKVAFGLTLKGGLWAEAEYTRKTTGASKLSSQMRVRSGGLWDWFWIFIYLFINEPKHQSSKA